jgi:hypothetical protein
MSRVVDNADAPPEAAAAQHVLQLATGYMLSAALNVAVRLGIADRLGDGPRSTADLASATGVNEDALYRVLRALSMAGVFREASPRTFALTPAASALRKGVPGSARDMVHWVCDPFHFRVYADLMHSVQTGQNLGDKALGMPVFEYLERDRELSASFNDAMTNFSASVAPAVIEAYDFSGIDVLVDVAGGHGMLLASILDRHPRMRGILVDLPHVIAGAKIPEALKVNDRCRIVEGDMFKAVPAGGDAYIMKHIIHDWDDQRAIQILGNIRTALAGKPNGRAIVIEGVIQPGDDTDMMKLIDIEMLVLPGGRERTAEEFRAMFAQAGFDLTRIVPTPSPLSVIEARPR